MKALLSAGQDFDTCTFPPSTSALGPASGEGRWCLFLFCLPCNRRMSDSRYVSPCQKLSAALNLLMVLIYFKCFSLSRVSALHQWNGTGLLLTLNCGNFSLTCQTSFTLCGANAVWYLQQTVSSLLCILPCKFFSTWRQKLKCHKAGSCIFLKHLWVRSQWAWRWR